MLARVFEVGLSGLLRFAMAFVVVGMEAALRVTVFLIPSVRQRSSPSPSRPPI